MFTTRVNKHVYGLAVRLFRKKRFEHFQNFLAQLPRPLTVLDIGGSREYWDQMGNGILLDAEITLVNLNPFEKDAVAFDLCAGDGRCLPFADQSFNLVFSNSVIEHLGSTAGQLAMAKEIRRVGTHYFIQTPNRNFPLEPHFLIPFFQFLPTDLQVWLLYRLHVEYFNERISTPDKARQTVDEIVMLTQKEFQTIFPNGKLVLEKFFGLTKSFMIYGKS